MASIVKNPTKAALVAVCNRVIAAIHNGAQSVTINGVLFAGFSQTGWCARNVRRAVEATVYGAEWAWPQGACCATSMALKLRAAGAGISRGKIRPGDLVAFSGGGKCRTCGRAVGHIGVYMGDNMLWQNTSYQSMGTCIIPIRESQWDAVIGVYAILPESVIEPIRVIEKATGKVVGTVVEDGLHVDDQRKIYVEVAG